MEPLAVAALILLALVVGVAALLGTRPGAVVARAVLRPLVRLVYAFRVEGGSLVPRTGGALLVANHVSYADAFLLGACVERPVRFLMHRSFLANPLVAAFARWVGAIPVAAGDTPQEREQALAAAARALTEGGLVAIFAEGRITRTGTLLGFRRGLETIARTAGAPIVPVALDEVWGSIFSYAGGRAVMKWPRRLPYRVRVAFGAPLPPDTPSHLVRDAIGELLARSAEQRALEEPDLARSFVRTARRHRRRVALVDERGEAVRYEQLLAASLALARTLRHALGEPRRVGVLLSPGRAAVEAHLALALAGRVVVAIDPALGTAGAVELVRRAGLSVVLGRREDARRLGLEGSAGSGGTRLLEVEDLRAEAARRHGGWARRRARRPAAWIEGRLSRLPAAADPAAVLVTSGTEAAARAVACHTPPWPRTCAPWPRWARSSRRTACSGCCPSATPSGTP